MSRSSSNLPAPTGGDFILYTAPDGAVKVDVFFKDETVWLTQKVLAELFGVKRPAITKHLQNIFSTGELVEDSVCSILEHTAGDGKTYSAKYYNLDAIIAVGYRVNSYQATQFRIWATRTLREFIIKGFALDDERLKRGKQVFGKDYFEELLERIREIRASERPSQIDDWMEDMPLRVLIAPDKFKGTLSATAAAEAIACGWRKERPADAIELLPMSDGGDGFGAVMGRLIGAREERIETVDAAHRPISAAWWWEPSTRTAIIESTTAVGLALLPAGKFHPFGLDTFGLGALLSAAARVRARRCMVGVGGSATNDGGFGVARDLGWRFRDARGTEITSWAELSTLARIEAPPVSPRFDKLTVAVDVQNPLLGPAGCTRVYGPQKGLKADDVELAERCLAQLARIAAAQLGLDCAGEPGAGAAGGLGFGLRVFAGASLESGFELFARQADLPDRIKGSQLVLTGEGQVDQQTLMGKGVGRLALLCRSCAVPCIGFAGSISDSPRLSELFRAAHALSPHFTSQSQSLAEPALWLERLAEAAAKEYRA